MEHRKPKTVSRKLDPEKQAGFIKAYEELLNRLDADEAVLFADAVLRRMRYGLWDARRRRKRRLRWRRPAVGNA